LVVFQGFKAQLAAMSLYLALSAVTVPVLVGTTDERPWAAIACAILLMYGMTLTYPHMLPLAGGTLGALSLAVAVQRRSVRPLIAGGGFLAAALAGAFLVSPYRVKVLLTSLRSTAEVTAGWFVPWMTPLEFLGFTGEGLFYWNHAWRSPA